MSSASDILVQRRRIILMNKKNNKIIKMKNSIFITDFGKQISREINIHMFRLLCVCNRQFSIEVCAPINWKSHNIFFRNSKVLAHVQLISILTTNTTKTNL